MTWKWKLLQEEIVIINNTTDVPMTLVRVAIRHALDNLPDKGAGIEIDEVIVRNKAEGKTFGQWGWYFPASRKIVVIVPRVIAAQGLLMKLKHCHQNITIKSRVEFLVTVMAHEMRHAYQYQVSKYCTKDSRSNHYYRERDAELYEVLAWMEWTTMVQKVASSSN
jgi:hypothetical protein